MGCFGSGADIPPPPEMTAEERGLIESQHLTLDDARDLLRIGATDSTEVQNILKNLSGFYKTETTPGTTSTKLSLGDFSQVPMGAVLKNTWEPMVKAYNAGENYKMPYTGEVLTPAQILEKAKAIPDMINSFATNGYKYTGPNPIVVTETKTPDTTRTVVDQDYVAGLRKKLATYETSLEEYNTQKNEATMQSVKNGIEELKQNFGILDETDKAITEALNRAPTEFEELTNENALLEAKRYNRALKGEIPLSETSKIEKRKEFELLKEVAARKGNVIEGDSPEEAIGKSTAANEVLGDFKERWALRDDAEKRGEIASGSSLSLSRTGLNSSISGQNFGQALNARGLASTPILPYGAPPGSLSTGYMTGAQGYSPATYIPTYLGLAGGYGSATQPYSNQRQLQYGGVLQGYENASTERAGLYNLIGTGIGSGIALYALSSRDAKKDILEMEEDDEDKALSLVTGGKVYRWNYKGEPSGPRRHMSLIAEEAPKEIVTEDGKHLDVGNYLGLLTGAMKSLVRKVEDMEVSLAG